MANITVTQAMIDAYQKDGVVLIKGLFSNWVDTLRAGVERNMSEPGPYAADNLLEGESGRFFDDYCNWQRIPEFKQTVLESEAGTVAAQLMQSNSVQVFHDHILIKEPGTSKPTPWHQDAPYYFVEGNQTISFWSPLDPVKEATLRCVVGSHLWDKPVLPVRWLSNDDFFPNKNAYMPVPDPDSDPDSYQITEWEMQPGDAVAFNYKTLHGARGNYTELRRRAFSLRLFGDDARYVARPGPTSPPFPGHDMQQGQKLREDLFPLIHS